MVSTSEVSVSLTIDSTGRLPDICAELRQFSEVETEDEQAIVCLVGENIRHTRGVSGRVFHALETVNVRMISQGASRLNLSLVVAEQDLVKAVEALHHEFFDQVDPAVFD
jgi:aspartate kinase